MLCDTVALAFRLHVTRFYDTPQDLHEPAPATTAVVALP
jgi:hypothetical protein